MVNTKLVQLRNKMKAKKPNFIRQDANHYKSLEKKWIKPKGMHSKMRIHLRGHKVSPSPGYSSPREVRGLNRRGYQEVRTINISDLNSYDSETQMVLIGHVGLRKKIELLKYCIEKKYTIANIKNPIEFVKSVENKIIADKKIKTEKLEKKKVAKAESLKKANTKKEEKKESKEEDKSPQDETKKGDKSEKIKVLEKKQ